MMLGRSPGSSHPPDRDGPYPKKYVVQINGIKDKSVTIKNPEVSSLTTVTNWQLFGPPEKTLPATMEFGPWGGQGGPKFYGGQGDIVQVVVYHNQSQINGIQTTYEQGGVTLESVTYGSANGNSSEITLDFPNEYLTQVKGTTTEAGYLGSNPLITSLTFITNKHTYGPYGVPNGPGFESSPSWLVTAFYGSPAGNGLHQFGVVATIDWETTYSYLLTCYARTPSRVRPWQREPTTPKVHPGKALPATMELGPWGGQGGPKFYGGQGDIVQVVVYHNQSQINGIQTTYEQGGVTLESVTYGSANGNSSEITLDFPNEYLTQVKGTTTEAGYLGSNPLITSLTFITNKHTYGPYGVPNGPGFESSPSWLVTAFYGSPAGNGLHQFGVVATIDWETTHSYLLTCYARTPSRVRPWQREPTTPKVHPGKALPATMELGPWGGQGGPKFYGGQGDIVQVVVYHNQSQINGIQTTYEQGGVTLESVTYGSANGNSSEITLDFPNEYLTQVKGTTTEAGYLGSNPLITSLTFITNKHTYGPYGVPNGPGFESSPSWLVTAFYGSPAGNGLHQFGVVATIDWETTHSYLLTCYARTPSRVRPWQREPTTPKVHPGKALPATMELGPWGGQGGPKFYGGQGDIVQVVVYHNQSQINGIQTTYEQGGVTLESVTYGSANGNSSEITLDFPNEYLTQVKGTTTEAGYLGSNPLITSLTFITNKHTYGPYGVPNGLGFESSPSWLVTAFYGSPAGNGLHQFGVVATIDWETTHSYLLTCYARTPSRVRPWQREPTTPKVHPGKALPATMELGPWGGQGGPKFYGGQGDIVQVVVYHNQSQINGIQTTYEQGGVTLESVTYGSANGNSSEITLDFPNEYLTQVKGTTTEAGYLGSNPLITSLTFITNKHTYGPYGVPNGPGFESSPSWLVTAFYGSPAGNGLHQFGVVATIDWETTHSYLLTCYARTPSRVRPWQREPTTPKVHPGKALPATMELGPWGGQGGPKFYGGQGDIVQVVVYHNQSQINGIQTTYEQGGVTLESVTYGSANGNSSEITLDFPNEYLTQVKGTTTEAGYLGSNPLITSLTFITNKHTYGPYGVPNGPGFESSPSWLVTAFYGSPAGNGLHQFGVVATIDWETTYSYLLTCYARTPSRVRPWQREPTTPKVHPGKALPATMELGPWGGQGGPKFYGGQGDIVQVVVYHNQSQINGIQTTYEQGGVTLESVTYGSANGNSSEITLDFPNEYLTQVKGTTTEAGYLGSNPLITSLTFITNKHTYGPYGVPNGPGFESSPSWLVTAFYGSPAGNGLHQFGVVATIDWETTHSYLLTCYARTPSRVRPWQREPTTPKVHPGKALPATMELGPWGGQGGPKFYGGQGDIVQVVVYHNQSQINGIQTTYEQGGVTLESVTYGSANGNSSEITLDFPNEYLTQVKGTTTEAGYLGSNPLITSLTFITNKHTYGPYGVPNGPGFESSPSWLVTAFYGSPAGDGLHQFGVMAAVDWETTYNYLLTCYARMPSRVRPWQREPTTAKVHPGKALPATVELGPWGGQGRPMFLGKFK